MKKWPWEVCAHMTRTILPVCLPSLWSCLNLDMRTPSLNVRSLALICLWKLKQEPTDLVQKQLPPFPAYLPGLWSWTSNCRLQGYMIVVLFNNKKCFKSIDTYSTWIIPSSETEFLWGVLAIVFCCCCGFVLGWSGIELRTSCMGGKCSASELHSQSSSVSVFWNRVLSSCPSWLWICSVARK